MTRAGDPLVSKAKHWSGANGCTGISITAGPKSGYLD